jgi:hypothetical protein
MKSNLLKAKSRFFNDGIFRIDLSEFETENKILIPGHRFIPFLNPEINPNKIIIRDNQVNIISKKVISVFPERIKKYYTLYGADDFLFLLIKDVKENNEIILNKTTLQKKYLITVFDLESFFTADRENLKGKKLSLELKINDWKKGIYQAELKEKTEDRERVSAWVKNLEKGLFKAEGYKKENYSIEDFLSTAFYFGGDYLIKNPVVTLDEFPDLSNGNFIASFHSDAVISRILGKRKKPLNNKIDSIIKKLTKLGKNISSGKIKADPENKITEEKILNTITSLKAISSELDNPEINEEQLNIIIKIIEDSEKLIQNS